MRNWTRACATRSRWARCYLSCWSSSLLGALRIYAQLDQAAAVQRALVRSARRAVRRARGAVQDEEIGLSAVTCEPRNQLSWIPSRRARRLRQGAQRPALRRRARSIEPQVRQVRSDDMGQHAPSWERNVADAALGLERSPKSAVRRLEDGRQGPRPIRFGPRRRRASSSCSTSSLSRPHSSSSCVKSTRRCADHPCSSVFASAPRDFSSSAAATQDALAWIDRERQIIETLCRRAFAPVGTRCRARGLAPPTFRRLATPRSGGDLFDVRRLGRDRGLVVVADVSGKGIEAAVNTAFVKYSLRTLALEIRRPGGNPRRRSIGCSSRRSSDPSLFVVVFVGIFDRAHVAVVRTPAPVTSGAFLRRGGEVTQLGVTGPIIGLDKSVHLCDPTLDVGSHTICSCSRPTA